jgi:hypothetical protein
MRISTLRKTGMESDNRFLPALAGFLCAAVAAWLLVSTHRYNSIVPLFALAAVHIALTVTANALGVRVAGYLLYGKVTGVSRLSTSAAAWLAPLAVSVKSSSPLAIPVAAVVAVFATLAMRQVIDSNDGRGRVSTRPARSDELFHLLPKPSPFRLLSFFGAAICAEAAFVEGTSGNQTIAVAVISLGAGIVAWQAGGAPGARSPTRFAGKLAFSWFALVLAFVLTTRAIRSETGGGGDEAIRRPGPTGAGGQYWGVMLWTDAPAPDPQQAKNTPLSIPSQFYKGMKVPLKIKFNGVYWFFRWPNRRLPSNADAMFGTPDQIGFHSTDSTPLIMEAHQLLENHIDLGCCSRIEVNARSADGFPGTIAVELLLSDSSAPLIRPLSLGQAKIVEMESFQHKSHDVTLNFGIPESPSVSSFNQITFRFYPNVNRRTVSPKVAIRDLTLIPR